MKKKTPLDIEKVAIEMKAIVIQVIFIENMEHKHSSLLNFANKHWEKTDL